MNNHCLPNIIRAGIWGQHFDKMITGSLNGVFNSGITMTPGDDVVANMTFHKGVIRLSMADLPSCYLILRQAPRFL